MSDDNDDNDPGVVEISTEEAVAAIEASTYCDGDGNPLVHCFIGFIGADWSRASAIDEVRKATRCAWVRTVWGEHLGIEVAGENVRLFDTVKAPEGVLA